MRDELLGHLCSVLRVMAIAAVVLTAYVRLGPADFVAFSQFHVGLSIAGFLECAAVVERSRLYADGEAGTLERAALLSSARRAGWICMLVGIGVSALWLSVGAVLLGAAIACLALPESAAIRESPERAARMELAALTIALAIVTGSWLSQSLPLGSAAAMLGLLACAPRLTLSTIWRASAATPAPLAASGRALSRNWRSIAPFATNQAALPWLFAVPNFVVPVYLPERESSWVLLGLRASGAVASMLARTLVQRWIQLTDGHKISAVPRLPFIALGLAFVLVLGGSMLDLEPSATAMALTTFLAIGCAVQAFLSTHMNARGHYLIQLPAFALFWLPGSVALSLAAGTAWTSPSLQLFAAVQSTGVLLAVLMMTMLSVDHSGARSTSSNDR